MKKKMIGLALMLAAAGCMTDGATSAGSEREGPTGGAAITDRNGQHKASADLIQVRNLVRVEIDADGLAPGKYGAHIHAIGRCEGPGFEGAGPHWNPTGRQHGAENPQGRHLGDLPNLEVDAQGRGLLIFAVQNASLRGGANPLLDADGAAIVIHAQADDHRTDPSGNSGARIACGEINLGTDH
jgi:Cu-Zn family superoxide dismutase